MYSGSSAAPPREGREPALKERWIIPLAVLVMIAGGVFFGVGAWRSAAAAPSYRESQSFSAGEVLTAVPHRLTHSFTVRNDRREPIEIREVKMDCSCTAWGAPKRRLEPGEVGAIEIDLTLNGSGPASSTADVLWSTGERSRLVFAAHAKVPREMFLSTYSLRLEPEGEAVVSVTFIDQQGWEPPPVHVEAPGEVEVKFGAWTRLTPDNAGDAIAERFISVGTVRLDRPLESVARVRVSLPGAGVPEREIVVHTPELAARYLETRAAAKTPAP